MISGSPGAGKTALAEAFLGSLYGESWNQHVHRFNGYDLRAISQKPFKKFVEGVKQSSATSSLYSSAPGRQLRVILVDEADFLPPRGQAVLRRLMEQHQRTSRFIFTLRHPSRLIAPIQSRCVHLRLGHRPELLIEFLAGVAEDLGLKPDLPLLRDICGMAHDNVRTSLMVFQALLATEEKPTKDLLFRLQGEITDRTVDQMLEHALAGRLEPSWKLLDVVMMEQGLEGEQVIRLLEQALMTQASGGRLPELVSRLGRLDRDLQDAANPRVHLRAFLLQIPN